MLRSQRTTGEVQPGVRWGPFTLRIPLIHTRTTLPELLQGILVPGATAMALAPLLISSFGLTFHEAILMCALHAFLLATAWMFFGEPYAPGWMTPALPLIFAFVFGSGYDHAEQFQLMTALSLNFAAILIFLGLTGLGEKIVTFVPTALRAGIILGASVAAFLRVFDMENTSNALVVAPIAATCGLSLCIIISFSRPVRVIAAKHGWVAAIVRTGLLPGFVLAGVVGFITGEFTFDIQTGVIPVSETAASLWQKTSPFVIGWPSITMFIEAIPIALITYTLFFGDLLTGNGLIEQAQPNRPDETIEMNNNRTHLSTGIRNIALAIFAPFFGTQGILWTGVHAIIIKRWQEGRDEMDSLFDGISSYYLLGVPKLALFFVLPYITLLKPLLPVALATTLILTGLSCAILALSIVKDAMERGVVVLIALALSVFEPWLGLVIGVTLILVVVGPSVFLPPRVADNRPLALDPEKSD